MNVNRVIANTTSTQQASDFGGDWIYITAIHNAHTSDATFEFGIHGNTSAETNKGSYLMDFAINSNHSVSFPMPIRCKEFKPGHSGLTVFFHVDVSRQPNA